MTSITEIKQNPAASFTQTSAIPLTTFFTPNSDCTAASAYSQSAWAGNQYAFQLDSGVTKPTCYPSSYSQLQKQSNLWFSPGVCPYSYQWVAASIQSPTSGPPITLAICCPPGVSTAPSTGWSCNHVLSTTVGGDLSFANTLASIEAETTLFANPISVAWQDSDLSLFTPASAPLIALKSAGLTLPPSLSIPSSTTSSASSPSPTVTNTPSSFPSSKMSPGAAAGIGVGATVAGILVIGALWWLKRHYKLARRDTPKQQPPLHEGSVRYMDGLQEHKYQSPWPLELSDTALPNEIGDRQSLPELEARPSKLPFRY